ncbi:sporulation transcription regulator WhiA [Andreesenia angusta]|uniref:Probable cell division protein WhiA n=1 Tax=Andreesenia angusta TaxID=39480 RepID=A0A1S1V5W3_9FIRM|nr:DNA-binding protein WhiA [Andreesenia angusta]OHW62051.1 sporulation transcription regulator WhiA [Andreesenia angusta]
MPSFSTTTKDEISKLELKSKCCLRAEIAAIIQMSGSLSISGGGISLKVTTENASIARRIFNLLKVIYEVHSDIVVRKNRQLKKNNSYMINVEGSEKVEHILRDIEVLRDRESIYYGLSNRISPNIVKDRCCKRAYIRGAFLGGGSISNPERTYHFEFITNDDEYSKDLSELVNSFGLKSKVVTRKDYYIVYIKEGEQVVDLLNIMGAHNALLRLEDIRVLKEMRNNINRIVNCETANLAKTINASLRQIKKIEFIDNTMGIENLPENLKEIARLRIENQDASLKELGELLSPPVGKSGVNHRLRKLEEIADELSEGGKRVDRENC